MSKMQSRTVNALSLLTDVFVEFDRMKRDLEKLRDELVLDPGTCHVEVSDARHRCRRIDMQLTGIRNLLQVSDGRGLAYEPPPGAPRGPLKLVS